MWKSVIYKEWLKTRWFLGLFALVGILAVGYMFLKVKHDIVFNEAHNYWYTIVFMGLPYFSLLNYIPLAGALAVAIAQYFPETVNKRIKLTFHLPLNENKVLLMMMLYGTFCLAVIYLLIFGLFLAFSAIYFPINIIWPAVCSITPWFLCGFVAYYLVALIVLEPVWMYRILYMIAAAAFIPVYMSYSEVGGYAGANGILIVLTIILSIALLFSGYRFRKGEM